MFTDRQPTYQYHLYKNGTGESIPSLIIELLVHQHQNNTEYQVTTSITTG
jgi:hypothetical protein